jgi:protein-S-isoprenylcysteine O-methyltransferase Ste14
MEIYLLASAWAAYFFVHSFLAATYVKKWVEISLPKAFPYYRIGYNIIAFSSLLPLLFWSITTPNKALNLPDWTWYAGVFFITLGLYLLIRAFQAFDGAEFLGLKEESTPILVQKGMYQYVRHPLYLATIVLIFGLFLCLPTQKMGLTLLISYLYIGIGYRLEERKLIAIFGTEYLAYQSRVKALIPYLV